MDSPDSGSSMQDLDRRLKAAKKKHEPKRLADDSSRDMSGVGVGLRIVVDLVAGVAVGVGIGWGLDNWLETKPWFLLLFTILGFCAGMLNVYRTARQLEDKKSQADATNGPDDDTGNGGA